MEFLVILLMITAVLYAVLIAPALRARKQSVASGSSRRAVTRPSGYTERPKMSPLLGIEISAAQQRRLGKNDPSVLAAKLYRQQKHQFASFQQTRPESHPPPDKRPMHGRLNKLFNDYIQDQPGGQPRDQSRHPAQSRQTPPPRPHYKS